MYGCVFDEPQMHYTLLEILPPKKAASQRAPINLCILIDRSTSMRGERMDRVRLATTSILKSLTPEDSTSVVAFSDRAKVVVTAEQARKMNIARARLSQRPGPRVQGRLRPGQARAGEEAADRARGCGSGTD